MKEPSKHHLHNGSAGAAIAVRLETHASRDQIAEVLSDGTLRVCLKTAASGDKANAPLLDYLAKALGVPAGRMEIVAGSRTGDKLVAILDIDSAELQNRILKLAGK